MSHGAAIRRLQTEFQNLTVSPVDGIVARPVKRGSRRAAWDDGEGSDELDLFFWIFALAGPEGSLYEGGVFRGTIAFPDDYPLAPPTVVFTDALTHPNVYGPGARRGEVCISILHTGVDATGYEQANERWSCVHGVRTILLSIVSMMADPNPESPANVDAAALMRRDPDAFKAIVAAEARRSVGLPAPAR